MLIDFPLSAHPELLYALARMGHGDTIVIADASFPSDSVAASCVVTTPLRIYNNSNLVLFKALISCGIFVMDRYDGPPVHVMQGLDNEASAAQQELAQCLNSLEFSDGLVVCPRSDFMEEAKRAFAIVSTADCTVGPSMIVRRGVVGATSGFSSLMAHPELLYTLARMGHGDTIVIADSNFPSDSVAARCVVTTPLRISDGSTTDLFREIAKIIPLETGAHASCMRRTDSDESSDLNVPTYAALRGILGEMGLSEQTYVERMAFYVEAKKAFAIIKTADSLPYANIIVKKGVNFKKSVSR
jgi:L-fucose mutarotase